MKVVSMGVTTAPFPNAKVDHGMVAMLEGFLAQAKRGEMTYCSVTYETHEEVGNDWAGSLPEDPYYYVGFMHGLIDDFKANYG